MEYNLVLHVPESQRFEVALKVARNFVRALGGAPHAVRVLVNAEGITILKRFEEVEELYREARRDGVEVYFCENAMRAFGIDPSLLPQGARTVPAGIKALVEWQNQGFRYVRA
ncbi:DsrE family protein [Thermosulfurimonas sp. F29]|uniref:DsrE family protein n=1 Tax=Thermosulfurimonas sp. F29 TaxID=2867247 RepID=UPI001C831178|nr:DsrE family protein [Thermosulfurimonas sp. F29]MBX6423244.1 DsrE family protein [Thermosulfurimonas sp. F29]